MPSPETTEFSAIDTRTPRWLCVIAFAPAAMFAAISAFLFLAYLRE